MIDSMAEFNIQRIVGAREDYQLARLYVVSNSGGEIA